MQQIVQKSTDFLRRIIVPVGHTCANTAIDFLKLNAAREQTVQLVVCCVWRSVPESWSHRQRSEAKVFRAHGEKADGERDSPVDFRKRAD